MEYCVYMHTCPKGKVYIGITRNDPLKRWQNGRGYRTNEYFTRAIKKYGWENFKHEILFTGLSEKEAKKKEIYLIAKYKSNQRKYGYNISSGGESRSGTKLTEDHKEKIRQGNLGKKVSEETRRKLSESSKRSWSNPEHVEYMRKINTGANNKMYGVKLTDEQKLLRKCKTVVQIDFNGFFVREFISIHEAYNVTKISRDSISKCCKGKYKQAGGYIWKFKEDFMEIEG